MGLPIPHDLGEFYLIKPYNIVKPTSILARIESAKIEHSWVEWYFHNKIFDETDWLLEPTETLTKLYQVRIKQLREQYEYLIVCFSGGQDSSNILLAAEQVGVYIDEIVTTGAFSLKTDMATFKLEEIETIGFPFVKSLKNLKYGKLTKLDLHELNTYPDYDAVGEEWILLTHHFPKPNPETRYGSMPFIGRYLPEMLKVGLKTTAIISGLDKPKIVKNSIGWGLQFTDAIQWAGQLLTVADDHIHPYQHVNYVNFYWHSDAVEILKKQLHVLIRFFERTGIDPTHLNTTEYNNLIIPEIYSFKVKRLYAKRDDVMVKNVTRNWMTELTNPNTTKCYNNGLALLDFIYETHPEFFEFKQRVKIMSSKCYYGKLL